MVKRYKVKKITKEKTKGMSNMKATELRKDKMALKALLMKNVKTDAKGRVLLSKDDEWRNEDEWDDIFKDKS